MAAGAVFKSDAVLTFERTLLQVVSQLKIQGFDMLNKTKCRNSSAFPGYFLTGNDSHTLKAGLLHRHSLGSSCNPRPLESSADVCGGGRLRDKPKEFLHRRLTKSLLAWNNLSFFFTVNTPTVGHCNLFILVLVVV